MFKIEFVSVHWLILDVHHSRLSSDKSKSLEAKPDQVNIEILVN